MGIGPKIPQALEKILQLKEIRQEQLTAAPAGKDAVNTLSLTTCAADNEKANSLRVFVCSQRRTTTRPTWT